MDLESNFKEKLVKLNSLKNELSNGGEENNHD